MFFKNDDSENKGPRRIVPALPLRDIIVFPHMVSQLFVGRERSIAALDEAMAQTKEIFLAAQRSDTIAANLPTIKLSDRQALLEMEDAKKRLERLYELMQAEIEILQVEKKIRSRVKKQMEKTQKEYYLNEQMQAIQKELGGGERDEFKNEIQEIEEKLKTKRSG